jgi:hypothetical protein
MRWSCYSGDSNKGPRSWHRLQGWQLLSFLGRPWRREGIEVCRAVPPLLLEAGAVLGAKGFLSPVRPGCHGGGSKCRCLVLWRLVRSHGAPLRRLIGGLFRHPAGLKSSRAAAPPLGGSIRWVPLCGAPSGASPATPSQSFRRAGINLEMEEGMDSITFCF